jgi:UDP-N-acetylglucosamine--N-acetylmuramyl-(pentapeptide) pyrophosphoryl-undecaprenol N-acetylglucosamine transferase
MTDALPWLEKFSGNLTITHQTGEADFDRIRDVYSGSGFASADIRPFISNMSGEFGKADLIISRAGATTCAELSAAGKASIMIPLPTAADDHQRKNAEALEAGGAAKMILQRDLTGEKLADEISRLVESPETITDMEQAAKAMGREDAAEKTADLIEELKRNV